MLSTSEGFRVLDAVGRRLTGIAFEGPKPGHVVRHADRTVLFTDGTGQVTSFDPHDLAKGRPATSTYTSASPHHGVAVEPEDGRPVSTLGTEEKRTGLIVLDGDRKEITRNEQCPGVHGEATAKDEVVAVGCEDGVLVHKDGRITKAKSPTAYGRIGNRAGSDLSPVVLGDFKKDEDAELERPRQASLINTTTGRTNLLDLGTGYTFRSLARGPHGEGLVLGTDGRIHVIDPEAGRVTGTIPVIGAWQEPLNWQRPYPALFVRDRTAYVTAPATGQVVEVRHEEHVLLAGDQAVDGGEPAGDTDGGTDRLRVGGQVVLAGMQVAGVGGEQRGKDLHGGGPAGAVGTEQCEDGSGRDVRVDAVEDALLTVRPAQTHGGDRGR